MFFWIGFLIGVHDLRLFQVGFLVKQGAVDFRESTECEILEKGQCEILESG